MRPNPRAKNTTAGTNGWTINSRVQLLLIRSRVQGAVSRRLGQIA